MIAMAQHPTVRNPGVSQAGRREPDYLATDSRFVRAESPEFEDFVLSHLAAGMNVTVLPQGKCWCQPGKAA